MLIKSLRMENFRQFKGQTMVEFSIDPNRNVTIILGNNTFGKTTLLQAFNWCFYGKVNFDHNPDQLINLELEAEMHEGDTQKVVVEIVVIHDNKEYVIRRAQNYKKLMGEVKGDKICAVTVSYKEPDGQTESVKVSQVDNVINNIFPQDLSTYFFFDTERVNSISTRRDVEDAVKGLLGLTMFESAMRHLGKTSAKKSVMGKLYASLDTSGMREAETAKKTMDVAQNEIELIAKQLDENATQIERYESRKEFLESILRNNQITGELQKRRDKIEKNITLDKSELEKEMSNFFKEFNHGAISFFSKPLVVQAAQFLKETKVDDKGVRDVTRATIEELIKRRYCICGAEISEGNEAYKHLMDELSFVPPESIGTTVKNYKMQLTRMERDAVMIYNRLDEKYASIYRMKCRVEEAEDEISEIDEKIHGKDNMSRYENELVDVKQKLKDLNHKKESLIRNEERQKNIIEQNKKINDKLIAVSQKNKETQMYLSYAEELYAWFEESYSHKEEELRKKLVEKVNALFAKMYHGQRRVVIDNKYRVSLLATVDGREVEAGESEGANRVKNFAFIAGLVALAKEKILEDEAEDGYDLGSEPYPLVMDAPFSNADETHTANISKVLPETAEQVIMFVMHKDWKYAEPVMSHRIGKQYQLNKISETHTVLA